jgi:signal transduction histidine kinase
MIAAVLFVSFIVSYVLFQTLDFHEYDNEDRLNVQPQKHSIEQGIYEQGPYPYIVFDLSGRVLYADEDFDIETGEEINVQEMLQFDKSFATKYKDTVKKSFVLQNNGTTEGFIVFLIPKSETNRNSGWSNSLSVYLPMILGIIISFIILFLRTRYFDHRVLKPLREISASAKAIIAGNYNLEILRSYWKRANENEVGDLSYAFELMRDELKSKQIMEEALKRSQKELISCISHDLKTPISTIKAYSEGLRDHIAKNPDQQQEFIGVIINKTDLLIDMINDLLNYSNAQLRQLEINRQELYFLDYFIPLMSEVKIYVEQNGFEFLYTAPGNNLIVTIDPKRITEVIYNLVENSMKYMDEKHGRISIEAELEDKYVLIKVIDNGPGISADDIPYVFDKFYRAEKSRSSSIPGSGLGLSICKYIVNEHGGEVYCKSSNQNGCEIGFTIE